MTQFLRTWFAYDADLAQHLITVNIGDLDDPDRELSDVFDEVHTKRPAAQH